MTKDDDKLIWGALLNERRNPDADTYDAEGELPGPIAELDPDIEEEEGGGCPNLDKLIATSESDEEDEDTDDDVIAKQGRGTTAAQFEAEDKGTYFG
jgi:hypothetical protein